jgi:hypothetical protein
MKKIITITAAMIISAFSAHAGVNMGVSGMVVDLNADGTETLKQSNGKTSKSHSKTLGAAEIFLELENSSGFAIGLAVIPLDAEIGSEFKSKVDEFMGTGAENADPDSRTVVNTATAKFSGHTTLYVTAPIKSSGFYVKAGYGQVDVKTTEQLETGAKYADDTINLYTVGLGFTKSLEGGFFARVEGAYTDYDTVSIKSTGSDAVSTVTGDIDTMAAKFTLGKSF